MWKRMIWGTLATILSVGCPKADTGGGAPVAAPVDELSALITQADALWEQRADEAKLKEAITAYELADAKDNKSRHVLERLTRAWYFWGDGFTTDKDLQIERWGKAVEYGNRCLALNDTYAAALANGQKEKDAASLMKKEDAPCLYWTATALGKWGKAQGIAKTIRYLPTVKAYISKAEEFDPTYFNYGPARYWGAYYSALPSFAGQDFEKSAQYFSASIDGAPYYLATRVLRAELLAVGKGDVKLFDSDLTFVLSAKADLKPEAGITPENLREIEKAKALLARRAELFDKDKIAAAGPAPSVGQPAPAPAPEVVPEPAPAPAPEAVPAPAPETAPAPAPAPVEAPKP